ERQADCRGNRHAGPTCRNHRTDHRHGRQHQQHVTRQWILDEMGKNPPERLLRMLAPDFFQRLVAQETTGATAILGIIRGDAVLTKVNAIYLAIPGSLLPRMVLAGVFHYSSPRTCAMCMINVL